MCFAVYFAKSLEATKKCFPITGMNARLPNLMEDKVGHRVHSEIFNERTSAGYLEVMELNE